MKTPANLKYTKSHEWIQTIDETTVVIGITDYAQNALGDIVFVNLGEVDDEVVMSENFGDAESVKAVSDLLSPVSGIISEINEELLDSPEKINEDCYAAWMIKVKDVSECEEVLSSEEYIEYVNSL